MTNIRTRTDSWAAKLTPDQQVELYRKAKQFGSRMQTLQWAATEFKLDKTPSQSSFYRWMKAMDDEARQQRLEETAIATAEAAAIGKETPSDETLIAAFKACALKSALAGDTKTAVEMTRIADTFHGHLMKEKAHDLAERRIKLLEREQIREMQALQEKLAAAEKQIQNAPRPFFFPGGGLPPIHPARHEDDTSDNPNT